MFAADFRSSGYLLIIKILSLCCLPSRLLSCEKQPCVVRTRDIMHRVNRSIRKASYISTPRSKVRRFLDARSTMVVCRAIRQCPSLHLSYFVSAHAPAYVSMPLPCPLSMTQSRGLLSAHGCFSCASRQPNKHSLEHTIKRLAPHRPTTQTTPDIPLEPLPINLQILCSLLV